MPGFLVESSFSRGEVTPELGGRVDIASYKTSLATCRNMIVRSYGGVYNRFGTQFIGFATGTGQGGAGTPSRLRKFQFNTTDVYILEFCEATMRVIRNDAYVLDTLKPVTAVTFISGSPALTITGHGYMTGDMLVLDSTFVGANLLRERWVVAQVIDANTIYIIDPITGQQILNAGTVYVSGGNAGHVYYIATPWSAADLTTLSFVQSADVMTITVADVTEYSLTRTGDAAWTLSAPGFAPTITAPTGLAVVPTTPDVEGYSYVVTAIDATTGEESLPCPSVSIANGALPASNTLTWAAPVGFTVSLYSVYSSINGVFGFIGDTPGLQFIDTGFAPDLSTTPPLANNPFTGGNFPQTAMYFQQRLIRSGSTANPDTLYCSQTGLFYNMSVSQPTVDSDALTFTLTSREVNAVRHMVPIKNDLIVFTAGQEWRVTANGAAFAAPNLAILPQSAWGSGFLEPILIGLTILYARENGMTVRSARYTYLSDAYTGEEASLLSSHLLTPQAQLTAWAFGITPDPVVIGVLSSGQATCQTYQEEQQINGWTRWDTAGNFETVEVTRPDLNSDSLDDEIYFVVNRVVNGNLNVRTVEKIRPRRFTDIRDCFFVDAGLSFDNPIPITAVTFLAGGLVEIGCGSPHGFTTGQIVSISDIVWMPTYDANWNLIVPNQLTGNNQTTVTVLDTQRFTLDGSNATGWVPYLSGGNARFCATTFSGLYHLEGTPVMALADGNVVQGLTVVNGSITLGFPAARCHIGRQYFSDVGTQSLEAPQGSIQGKEVRVPYVTIRVVNSRGWIQGQTNDDLVEPALRQFENVGDPLAMFTGDVISTLGSQDEKNGTVFIRQPYPLPLEILDIIPAIEVED